MNMKVNFLLPLLLLAAVSCAPKQQSASDIDKCGVVRRVDTLSNKVYLVFTAHFSESDSGYFENFDGIIPVLDVLKEKDVKGSFFPTGACFSQPKYEEAFRRIIDEGHYLSHHSDAHLYLCADDDPLQDYVTADSVNADIAAVEAKLAKLGLEKSDYPWMIPPYEHYNHSTADMLRNCGYKLVNPTPGINTGSDWMGKESPAYKSAEEQLATIWAYEKSHSLNGCVILVHAMVYPDREDNDRIFTHLGEIIDGIRECGYDFGTFKDVQ